MSNPDWYNLSSILRQDISETMQNYGDSKMNDTLILEVEVENKDEINDLIEYIRSHKDVYNVAKRLIYDYNV